MIVWGWNEKQVGSYKINGVCANCHSHNLSLVGLQRYFHIFWIPTIPLKKSTCVACIDCHSIFLSNVYLEGVSARSTSFKTPWWSFSGAAVIAVLIVTLFNLDSSLQDDKIAFKDNPQAGKYFTFKSSETPLKETPFTYAMIEEVKDDKIFIRFSHYAYSKDRMAVRSARSSKDKPNEPLASEVFELTKDEFKAIDIRTLID